jgi:SAM-dependent methyltransferase
MSIDDTIQPAADSCVAAQNARDIQRLSFGAVAEAYDRIRPTYPIEAVAWALGDKTGRVVDIGAGTGLLTRVVRQLADEVIPIDPDPGMRSQLDASSPGLVALAGSAEAMPLDDGSADAVVAGQAYHWFDHERAHAEIARVLRPGGVFAPIWNMRDESVAWVATLTEAFEGRQIDAHEGVMEKANFGPSFGPVDSAKFRHSVTFTSDGLVALMESRSYFLTAPDNERAEMAERVREIAADLGETFEMPYVTYCYRAVKS